MGRNVYGPKLAWAEMVICRNDQLPLRSSGETSLHYAPLRTFVVLFDQNNNILCH